MGGMYTTLLLALALAAMPALAAAAPLANAAEGAPAGMPYRLALPHPPDMLPCHYCSRLATAGAIALPFLSHYLAASQPAQPTNTLVFTLSAETATMRRLRAAAAHSQGGQPARCAALGRLAGWSPADDIHHCRWALVSCDAQQRVTLINLSRAAPVPASDAAAASAAGRNAQLAGGSGGSSGDITAGNATGVTSGPGLLLPGLARLPALQRLVIEVCDLSSSSLPREWGQPGAFPSLTRCG